MASVEHKGNCAFEMLLSKSVPHVLEKIFFSLDYDSFKNCHQVCNGWKDLLISEPFQTKSKLVCLYQRLQERYNLLTPEREKRSNELALLEKSKFGTLEEVKSLLLKGIDPNCKHTNCKDTDYWGRIWWRKTPLNWAVEKGNPELTKLLLDAGAEFNNADLFGATPLYSAVYNHHKDVARLLLDKGADPNPTDSHGNTILSLAATRGHKDIVKLLLDAGADPNKYEFK